MKLGKTVIDNFQSYEHTEFDYSDLGIALISGETGAGKSTFLDAPAWCIFGVTSKDGAADDVRAWGSNEATRVETEVFLPDGKITVTRIRGKSSQNDLYWTENGGEPIRGKNAPETQKLLEQRLGMTAERFLTSSYMTQFMDGGKFFTQTGKERRPTLDKIADLKTPNLLAERASEARKSAKKALDNAVELNAKAKGRLEVLTRTVERTREDCERWADMQLIRINDLRKQAENFEADRNSQIETLVSQLEQVDSMIKEDSEFDAKEKQAQAQLKALTPLKSERKELEPRLRTARVNAATLKAQFEKLSTISAETCSVCLGPTRNPNRLREIEKVKQQWYEANEAVEPLEDRMNKIDEALAIEDSLRKALDKIVRDRSSNNALVEKFRTLQAKILGLRDSVNRHEAQLELARKDLNPHTVALDRVERELAQAEVEHAETEGTVQGFQHRVFSLTWLYDKAFALRGMLLQKAVRSLNKRMNDILERYFGANLRVTMTLSDADSLEVVINNSGYPCKFGQLSGGERAQLKLAFSIALLEASQNTAGRKFETIMFDEALNGMSDKLKREAFGVFQELGKEHGTVLLIDHCEELKSFFSRRFLVTKKGSISAIQELDG
jgi:exonuclease SbcC